MKKHEWIMMIAVAVLMITGCLFVPMANYYGLIRCIHSLAALVLLVAIIFHVKGRVKTQKEKN